MDNDQFPYKSTFDIGIMIFQDLPILAKIGI